MSDIRDLTDLLKGKRDPIGTVRNGRKKVAEGKWVDEKTGQLGQAPEPTPEENHQNSEAKRHLDEAVKYKEVVDKIKKMIKDRKSIDPDFQVPEKAQEFLKDAQVKVKAHTEDYRSKNKPSSDSKASEEPKKESKPESKDKKPSLGQFKGQIKDGYEQIKQSVENWENYLEDHPEDEKGQEMLKIFKKNLEEFAKLNMKYVKKSEITELNGLLKEKLRKSIKDMANEPYLRPADHAIAEQASGEWLEKFQSLMENYNYGDAPRELALSNGYSIMMTKVDDGIYSGYVKQSIDRDGEPLEENVAKVDKQSLPDTIQYLKAREYIMPSKTSQEIGEAYAEAMREAGEEIERQEQERLEKERLEAEMAQSSSNKLRFMELLDRVLNRL